MPPTKYFRKTFDVTRVLQFGHESRLNCRFKRRLSVSASGNGPPESAADRQKWAQVSSFCVADFLNRTADEWTGDRPLTTLQRRWTRRERMSHYGHAHETQSGHHPDGNRRR